VNEKQAAAEMAVEFVEDGMIVGLGTGSTITYLVKKLAQKVREGLNITTVSTSSLNGIKGGGGALLFEKIVAASSRKNIWIVDSTKLVDNLGRFPLPVEVVPFGIEHTVSKLKEEGYNPELRIVNEKIFHTDGNHYTIDLHLNKITEPAKLETELKKIPGVIETGLFINIANMVIVGRANSYEILRRG